MNKIAIIGSPGAGKSTLARQLGAILKVGVIHLDCYFWEPGWKEKPREVRRQILQELVKKDKWIIEGTYLDTSDIRFRAADTIIFLDMPGLICFFRVLHRYFKDPKERRPDLPEGCRDKLGAYYSLKILGFPLIKREELYRYLGKFSHEKRVYALQSRLAVAEFLLKVEQRQTLKEYELENQHVINLMPEDLALGFNPYFINFIYQSHSQSQ